MANKKLSKAQQRVMDEIYQKIDRARSCETYEEYFNRFDHKYYSRFDTSEEFREEWPESYEIAFNGWNQRRNAFALVSCSSSTLYVLEKRGLIKIIEDSNGQRYGIDVVKALNY